MDNDDYDRLWKYKEISGHEGPLKPSDPRYKGDRYNVRVEWEDGSCTYEPKKILMKDDPYPSCPLCREGWPTRHVWMADPWPLYQAEDQAYYIDRRVSGETDFSEHFPGLHRGAVDYEQEQIDMLIYLDHASIELFADDGRCVMTEIVFPVNPYDKIELISEGETAELLGGTMYELEGIWNR